MMKKTIRSMNLFSSIVCTRASTKATPTTLMIQPDEEGKEQFLSECTLQAYNERTARNCEYSLRLEWPQYEEFGCKVMLDKRIRKMKHDRIEQLRSRAYEASMSSEEKAEFWDIHNWWQSLSKEEKRLEVNIKKRPAEIIAEMRKHRNQL